MLDAIFYFAEHLIRSFGPLGVFFASFIEEVIVPIPSTLIMSFAGAVFLNGLSGFDFFFGLIFFVALPVSLGLTLGSSVLYAFFYFVGRPGIEKYGKFFGLSWKDVEKISQKLEKSGRNSYALFFLRATPFVPSAVLNAFCGVIRWKYRSFAFITFVGTFIRASILGSLGFFLGVAAVRVSHIFKTLEDDIFILSGVIFLAFLFFWRKRRKRKILVE
ncbi:MAG: VTT domain-containing protein [Patescibacteria group bacterium]